MKAEEIYFIYCSILTIAYLVAITIHVYKGWHTEELSSVDIFLYYTGGVIAVFSFVSAIILILAPILIPMGIINYIRKGEFIS
jgi:hypothetical protein